MSTLTAPAEGGFASYIRSTIHQLQPASSFATWSCLYSAIQTRVDFWLQHLTPEETEATCHTVDAGCRRLGGRACAGSYIHRTGQHACHRLEAFVDEAESLCTLTRRIKEKRPCGTYTRIHG